MSGIYIHIPFCKQKCSYCDFHFSTSLKDKPALIKALLTEIKSKKDLLNHPIETIYFGGGTPSLLTIEDLKLIIEAVYKNYNVASNIEFTLECNPDDLTKEKLQELKTVGVNRLSIGVQSFFDEELRFYHRAHTAIEAERSVLLSQDVGFDNITIDLIYGSPILSDEMWLENLQKVKQFEIPHLSAYTLTVEKNTALAHQIKTGQLPELNEDKAIAQFKTLIAEAKKMGLTHYEVSNFGKESYFSKHNSNYWKGESYLGFGPSAHSFIKTSPLERGLRGVSKRCWNIANNKKYIKALLQGETYFEEEIIDEITAFNEYLLTRLRTIWGIDLQYLKSTFNSKLVAHFEQEIQAYLNSSYLQQLNNKLTLTEEGILIADKITSDLFYV